jgi:hypothetical protein
MRIELVEQLGQLVRIPSLRRLRSRLDGRNPGADGLDVLARLGSESLGGGVRVLSLQRLDLALQLLVLSFQDVQFNLGVLALCGP